MVYWKKSRKMQLLLNLKKKPYWQLKGKFFELTKKNVNYGQFVYIGLLIADYRLIISLDECIDLKNKFYLTENVILQINIRYKINSLFLGFFFFIRDNNPTYCNL